VPRSILSLRQRGLTTDSTHIAIKLIQSTQKMFLELIGQFPRVTCPSADPKNVRGSIEAMLPRLHSPSNLKNIL
jgi:hypothetical protein